MAWANLFYYKWKYDKFYKKIAQEITELIELLVTNWLLSAPIKNTKNCSLGEFSGPHGVTKYGSG